MKLANRVLGVLALLTATFSPVAEGQVRSMDALVSLRAVDQPLTDVVQFLRDRSGANIVVIPNPDDPIPRVSIELTEVPWRDALNLIAAKARFTVDERDAGILEVRNPKRVDFQFKDQPVRDVIDSIALASGASMVMSPAVTGTITVRLENVPWREALESVAKTLDFAVVEERYGVLRIVDPASLTTQLVTRSYQLRYLRPRGDYVPIINSEFVKRNALNLAAGTRVADRFSVLPALQKALNPGIGDMDYIEDHNVVVVRDTVQVHQQIEDVLARLDVAPQQVFCDVKFVSTNNNEVINLGVDYGDGGPSVSLSGGQIPVTFPFNEGNGGWGDLIIAGPGGAGPFLDPAQNASARTIVPDTIFGALSFQQVQATLRLLQRDTKSEVIQAPKIIALDGREATIFVGETVRYAEAQSEQGQAGGLQLSVVEAGGSPVEVGFQLLIRPQVIPGTSRIMLDVIPKETSLSGLGNSQLAPPGFDVFTIGAAGLEGSIALPRTRSSTMVTTMMLDSGQTAVLGGLSTDSETEVISRVPGLWRIPLLGRLFQYENTQRDRRSLLVFLTPTLVQSADDTERLLQRELGRRRAHLRDELEALVTPVVDSDQGGVFDEF